MFDPLSALVAFSALGRTDAFLTHPDIHGDRVVFTAEGDLWLGDIRTEEAWRITSDSGMETAAHFSPDGKMIAFTANYDGGNDVYVMSADGGEPKRLTYDTSDEEQQGAMVQGWTPDGKNVLFSSSANMYAPPFEQQLTQQLYSVTVAGGLPTRLPIPRGTMATIAPDGRHVAYVPASSSNWMNWFRYQGGQADRLWMTDLQTHRFTALTDSKSVDTEPAWMGAKLFFVSERSGVRNLWWLDPATKKSSQVTFSRDLPVRFPSSDGQRVVFQLGPKLAILDPGSGRMKPLDLRLHSDRIHARPFEASFTGESGDRLGSIALALSPDAKRVALAPRGHLITVPAERGAVRTLIEDSSQRVMNPVWSPDGAQLAFLSDAGGEEQLYLCADQDQARARQLTRDLKGQHGTPVWSPDGRFILLGDRTGRIELIDVQTGAVKTVAQNLGENPAFAVQTDFSFSPDGKWMAYSNSAGWRFATVYLYEIATGKSTRVSHPDIDSNCPTFSADGRYLFMIQARNISQEWVGISSRMNQKYRNAITAVPLGRNTPSPFDDASGSDTGVDLEGIDVRYFDMEVPAGDYNGLLAAPGRLLIQSGSGVSVCDLKTRKITPLANDLQMVGLSRDGKMLLVSQAGGAHPQVIDVGAGLTSPEVGALALDGLTVSVDPVKEWRQIFYEAWRITRDFYYDPNMHGLDWNAVRAKYEAQLPLVSCRYDLMLLIRNMISELGTGHSFTGAWPDFPRKKPRPATLGIDLVWDSAANAYQITHILRGIAWNPEDRSPLAAPGLGVKEGDHLLAISGKPLKADEDPAANLLGKADREVEITLSGGRTLTVKPLASDRNLRMLDWVESRRAYVEKASNGQIAYVCLGNMSDKGATQFAEQYYPNVNRPGLIFDVRGNDGGNISGNILLEMSSRPSAFFAYRAGGNYRRESWAPMGVMAALANEWSFSDADYFSEMFQRMKLGPLIGHRTAGAVVGPASYRFVDGSGIAIPNYGAWAAGEWIVEGHGAVPDFEVDQEPEALLAGRDLQLEKAVEVLMAQLKAKPFKMPEHPLYPIRR